jgi:hypothetical protein
LNCKESSTSEDISKGYSKGYLTGKLIRSLSMTMTIIKILGKQLDFKILYIF